MALSAASDPKANLVISPFSLGVALTMASAGAAGDTLVQMHQVLGINTDDPHSALSAMVDDVERHGAHYAAGDGTQSVVLPYTDGYEMVVVLPAPGRLVDLVQAVADAGGDLDTVVGEFAPTEVSLELPVWDIAAAADLAPQLQALGMALAFDTDQADFSNITTDEPLSISAVIHQAKITVDEAGTEAGAVLFQGHINDPSA